MLCIFLEDRAALLGISMLEPPRPAKPTENDMAVGSDKKCKSVKEYILELYPYVVWKLSNFLHDHDRIALRQPLTAELTPSFDHDGTRGQTRSVPTTYKEPWNMKNCERSLKNNLLYEAALTIWQYDALAGVWSDAQGEDVDLGLDSLTWQGLIACGGLWGNEAVKSSADDPADGRLIFPCFLPTAINSISTLKDLAKHGNFFRGLPVFAGRAVLWSLIVAFDEALEDFDKDPANPEFKNRIVKLYEASVTVTGRMRLDPSSSQVILDQMMFDDQLRVLNVASGAASCFEWIIQAGRLVEIDETLTSPTIVKKLEEYGVVFKGKVPDRSLAFAIMSVVGIADKDPGMAAVRFLESVNPAVFGDVSKVCRTFQVLKKLALKVEWYEACRMVMEFIGVAILSGDEAPDTFTFDYLTPKARRKIGFVDICVRKFAFMRYIIDEALDHAASGATNGKLTSEGVSAIKYKCATPLIFWENFSGEAVPQDRTK